MNSKELGKEVSYNFTVASGGSLAAPSSSVDTIASLDQFGDVADPILLSLTQPSVAVKVIDRKNNAIYVWSLDRMYQQLQRMRNLTTYIDRPSYTQHFSSDEPFFDLPPPEYSFIGNALVSLAPLSRRMSSVSTVPIFCRYTSEAIGSCRVEIKVVNVVLSAKYAHANMHVHGSSAPVTRSTSPVPGAVPPGSKLSFFLTIDSVKGLSSHDFSGVHCQVRLSSFVGPGAQAEEVFPSGVLDMERSGLSELKFRRSFVVVTTSKVLTHMKAGYAPIEFFAALKPTYLERMERWDELREHKGFISRPQQQQDGESTSSHPGSISASTSLASTTLQSSPASGSAVILPPMRRSENEFVVEQNHDVVAWLQICELGPDGTYQPVPVVSQGSVDPGVFSLHQGLQRRVVISLSSHSGLQLPWQEFTKVRIGNVRLLDAKGRVHDSTSKALVTLPLLKEQNLEFKPDGSGALSAEVLWDSSVHDSVLLNRVTASNQRVLLQLTWAVAVETCADPVHFSMDVAIGMQTRDAAPPSRLLTFFGSSKILTKTSTLFAVKLSPPLTRSAKDLWRLDTSEKYVRGEESLGAWKPRGISVVEDYERLVTTETKAADVQAVRVILSASPPRPVQTDALAWKADELLRRSVGLWQKQFGHKGKVSSTTLPLESRVHFLQIVLSQDPVEDDKAAKFKDPSHIDGLKLISETRVVPRR